MFKKYFLQINPRFASICNNIVLKKYMLYEDKLCQSNYKVIIPHVAFIIFKYVTIMGCILHRHKESGH